MPNYGTKGDLLDMYDINRRPLGYTKGYFEKREAGEFFLASHVWIINDKKQFLIQKRSPTKVCEPGKWSVTGGVADSGENTLDCCIREQKKRLIWTCGRRKWSLSCRQRNPTIGAAGLTSIWCISAGAK